MRYLSLILISFFIFSISSPCFSALDVRRFNQIVKAHKDHLSQNNNPVKSNAYYGIEDLSKLKNNDQTFLVMSGKNFLNSRIQKDLNQALLTNAAVTVIVDFHKSDCSDEDVLNLTALQLPLDLKHLILSNVKGGIKAMHPYFLSRCTLKTLSLIGFDDLEVITNDFLTDALDLTALDLSNLPELQAISFDFIHTCTNLKNIDLRNLKKCICTISSDTSPSFYFNKRSKLANVMVNNDTPTDLIYALTLELQRTDSNERLKFAKKLHRAHVQPIPKNVETILKDLNLAKIRDMTPKCLEDIKGLSGKGVVEGYKTVFEKIKKYMKPKIQRRFKHSFLPILTYLYVDKKTPLKWNIYKEDRPQLSIAFKHLLKKFQDLSASGKDDFVGSYFMVLLEAFHECSTRQVMDLNQIMANLGIQTCPTPGIQGDVWNWVNEFKSETYTAMLKEASTSIGTPKQSSHIYALFFATVNKNVQLPFAIRTFKDHLIPPSFMDEDMIFFYYLIHHFNKPSLVDFVYNRIQSSSIPSIDIRGEIANMEGVTTMSRFNTNKDGYNAYFKPLAGKAAPQDFEWETSPITKGEVERLLFLLRALNK